MSWKDEEIDGLFKQAKTPEAPAFEESFWTEMEAMLPPQQKRRKAGFWWISAAMVVLLAIGGITLWAVQDETTATRTAETTASQQQPATEQLSAGTEQPTESASAEPATTQLNATTPTASNRTISGNGPAVDRTNHPAQQNNGNGQTDVITQDVVTEPVESIATAPAEEETPQTVDRLPVTRFALAGTRVAQSYVIPPRYEHFYIQATGGIGQSAITGVAGRSDMIQCYTLGAGVYGPRAGRMYLNLGLQGRVDIVQNLSGTVSNPDNTKTDTRYRQLYAIEAPLAMGLRYGRNSFAMVVTPGFQLGFTGTYRQYDMNNVELRSERTSGKIASGKTLTMEVGLSYMRQLYPNWYLGASCNADILRPFGDQTFDGKQRTLPLNGCILLRRTF